MSGTLAWLYYTVCVLLAVFGTYRVLLLVAYSSRRRIVRDAPTTTPLDWPQVTVQLPLYNERYVARRLLAAVSRLDYPADRLQIQILDDSTDHTLRLTRRLAAALRRRGLDVQHLHRDSRTGYKAGALAAGLERARGDLVAIFDADFVPPPDFLRRMVPQVLQPGVGMVQARWGHLNRDATWFTRLQAILLDGHFVIEQPARASAGCFLSFNGTGGIWRRAAITDAGGWSSDTLTEDLDLSLRAQLAGWRAVYDADHVVPGELPRDSNAFRAQQLRWTKGGVQVARKLLPSILAAPLPWHVKAEAALHLTCYGAYPLLVLLVLLRAPVRWLLPQHGSLGLLPGEIGLLLAGTLPLVVHYLLGQRGAGVPGPMSRRLLWCFPAMALGAGLALSNSRAVLEGLVGRGRTFERTPKLGGVPRHRIAPGYSAPGTSAACLEVLLIAYILVWRVLGSGRTVLGDLPFLGFFSFGLLAMSLPSLRQALSRAP